MEEKEINELMERIREKVGEETSALISDDLGLIITNNSNMLKERSELNKNIQNLQKDKENLISANGNLLKQIPMGIEEDNFSYNKKEEKPKEEFSFKKMFDEKGNFIR